MKPIQQHKDPRITNISFNNFTGSICIINSQSDDDEETKDLMLSSPQTNVRTDLFKPHHHLALITQPVLGARSRKKDKTDSITNSRRSSLNDSPSFIVPINRKINHYESSDSGLDFSLSTNSSVQYPQQYPTIHRPLSALNEDSNTDDGFHDQPNRFPIGNYGHHHSIQNIIHDNKSESLFPNEQEKRIKKSHDNSHLTEFRQEINLHKMELLHRPSPPIQQYYSLNDLTHQTHTIIQKQNKLSRKKTKLNIIVQPSSHINLNNEQIHSITRTTSSSSNQTTFRNEKIKPKAITPLGHYPNQEQIRAHINRSVIERQHPSYLANPTRKGLIQKTIPFDASPSKVNNLLSRQQKQLNNIYYSNPNIQGGNSTIQHLHIAPSRQTKQTLAGLYNDQINEEYREKRNQKEKRHLNDINKYQEKEQKEQFRIKVKDIQEPFKTNPRRESRQDQIDNFLTSTPRRHDEHDQSNDKGQRRNRRQQPPPTHPKNHTINPNTELKAEYSPRNPIAPFQSRPKKLIRIPNVQNLTEQNSQFHQRQKSPTESINSLLQTTRIQPMNINNSRRENEVHRLSKMNLTQFNKEQTNTNHFFQARSPTSWSVISDHQHEPSSSSHNQLIHDKSTRTYRLIVIDTQEPLDGRHVIPTDNSQLPTFVNCASQTSSHHTYPFICTTESNNINDISIENSPYELIAPQNSEYIFDHQSCSSSSLDCFSPNDRFPLPLGKVTIDMEKDDISTNYDSDDGWSEDSAEIIYADERYTTQKKRNIYSSSHLISQ